MRVVAVSGEKHTGKTTLIAGLTAYLTGLGLRVAVIKHDGHAFSPDRPGTDTFCHWQAGAVGTAVFDGEKFQLVRREKVTEAALLACFPEADVIFLEGFKHSHRQKIEVLDGGTPLCDPATVLAYASDGPAPAGTVPVFARCDYEALARLVLSLPEEAPAIGCCADGGFSV